MPRSFIGIELSAPGMATLLWLGHFAKPLLAPVALGATPLPPAAKVGHAAAAIIEAAGLVIAKANFRPRMDEIVTRGEV